MYQRIDKCNRSILKPSKRKKNKKKRMGERRRKGRGGKNKARKEGNY